MGLNIGGWGLCSFLNQYAVVDLTGKGVEKLKYCDDAHGYWVLGRTLDSGSEHLQVLSFSTES